MTDAEETKIVTRVGEAMKGAFRVDDVVGRLADDVFALLLRGCPLDMHRTIEDRCRTDLSEVRLQTPEGWLGIDAVFVTVPFEGDGMGKSVVEKALASFA